TPGPGTVGFQSDTYSIDEDAGSVFIVMGRDNGHLGAVNGSVATSDLPQGPGAATEGLDYLATQSAIDWPTARTIGNFSRQVSEAYRGLNSGERFVTDVEPGHGLPGTNSVAPVLTFPLFIPILDDNIPEGDEQLQLNFTTTQALT